MTTQLDARLTAILIILCGIMYVLTFDVWRTQVAVACYILVTCVMVLGEVMK